MSDEIGDTDPYEAVLTALRLQRDKIDQAITTIESIRASLGVPGVTVVTGARSSGQPQSESLGEGAFLGMSIVDASRKLLSKRRRQLGVAEIASELKRGGLALNSREPANTVGSVLTRQFNGGGDIVRVERGTWGLKEWYPHTNFRSKRNGPEKDTEVNKELTPDPVNPSTQQTVEENV